MRLFKKKIIPRILNRGLLAEAITIYSQEINLENYLRSMSKKYPQDTIHLNEHLTITIDDIWHHYDVTPGIIAGIISIDCFHMSVSTHVDGIKMASYEFTLDIDVDHELYREWDCEKCDIIHRMPNQFVDLMNRWSKHTASTFNQRRKQKKLEFDLSMKEVYNREESILNKYR